MVLNLINVLSATVWVNMTVYDVLPEDCRHTISEKNVGDPAGDAFFNVKDKYLPVACAKCKADPALCRHDAAAFDCTNPESNGNLVVRKIEVEVSGLDDKGYTLCNDQRGKCGYYCAGPYFPDPHHVPTGIGLEAVCAGCNMAPRPSYAHGQNFDFWDYNVAALLGAGGAGGQWFSLRKRVAEHFKTPTDKGVFWRNARVVKAINSKCQATALDAAVAKTGAGCFDLCPQPANASSACWVDCFFETVLGKGHNSSVAPEGGMRASDVTAAWLRGFESDEPAQGGCPACPALGPCPAPPPAAPVPLVES